MGRAMRKGPRRAVFDDAGRAYELARELERLQAERRRLDDRIRALEQKLGEARRRFEASFEKAVELAGSGRSGLDADSAEQTVTPGKLPYRVLARMRSEPQRLFTAASLQADLGVDDIQQVRTALARLAGKGLVRRTDVKGEFTI